MTTLDDMSREAGWYDRRYIPMEARIKEMEEERDLLLEWVWLNHGHTGQYGDDGEMQCAQCEMEYGFFDWKRTPVSEIFEKIRAAKIDALHTTETEVK